MSALSNGVAPHVIAVCADTCTIEHIEAKLFQFEEVRVIFRHPKTLNVREYPYVKMMGDSTYVWALRERIEKVYPSLEFEIVDGYGIADHYYGKRLNELRKTYSS